MLWHWITDCYRNSRDFFTSVRNLATDSLAWLLFLNNDTNRLSMWSSFEPFVTSYQVKLLQRDDSNSRLLKYFLTLWTLSLTLLTNCSNVVTLILPSLQQFWRFLYKCKDSSKGFRLWRFHCKCKSLAKDSVSWTQFINNDTNRWLKMHLWACRYNIFSHFSEKMTLIFHCWSVSWLSELFFSSYSWTDRILWHLVTNRCRNSRDFFTSVRNLATDSLAWLLFLSNDTNRLSMWSSFEPFVTSYQVKLLQRDDSNSRLLKYFLTLW